jgi:hypothetical protein
LKAMKAMKRLNSWAGSGGRYCYSILNLNHPLQDNKYQNIFTSDLAVIGVRDDGGWLDAEDYAPKYSAIIKLA